jgi:hypothetical protein
MNLLLHPRQEITLDASDKVSNSASLGAPIGLRRLTSFCLSISCDLVFSRSVATSTGPGIANVCRHNRQLFRRHSLGASHARCGCARSNHAFIALGSDAMPLGLGGFTCALGDEFVGSGRFTLGLFLGGLAGLPKARCPRVVGHARCLDEGCFGLLRDRSAGCLEFFFVFQHEKS